MKTKRKITSLLLSVCLAIGLTTTVVSAAGSDTDGNSAISLGTSTISDPTLETGDGGQYYTPNSYIYFGKNEDTPILWRVLDADKANDGTTSGMFLLSEYLWAADVAFAVDGNIWQNSAAQAWCKSFAANSGIFQRTEQAAMAGIAKSDSAEGALYDMAWGASELKADVDKMFFLSVKELADYVGDYDGAPGLVAKWSEYGNPGEWWLRSPDALTDYNAGTVNFEGIVDVMIAPIGWAARPAFNLDPTAVLFTSAATGGKVSGENAISSVGTTDTDEWKLTLIDSNREFAVSGKDAALVAPGAKLTMNYTGATVYDSEKAPNEYISVIITSDSDVLYYGRVAQPTSSNGTVQITIPADLAEGSYTLKVFSEQYNGGANDDTKLTDYASKFDEITLTVDAEAGDAALGDDEGTQNPGGEGEGTQKPDGEGESTQQPEDDGDNNDSDDNDTTDSNDDNSNSVADDNVVKLNDAPESGDNSMRGLWCGLATICLIIVSVLCFFKKVKKAE